MVELVDTQDLNNLSALVETPEVELLKLGEAFPRLKRDGNPEPSPDKTFVREGVET